MEEQLELMLDSYTVITKDNCKWCVLAKKLLKKNKIPFREMTIPEQFSREEFRTLAEKHDAKPTVPKIFIGARLIGGYEDLLFHLDNLDGGIGEGPL